MKRLTNISTIFLKSAYSYVAFLTLIGCSFLISTLSQAVDQGSLSFIGDFSAEKEPTSVAFSPFIEKLNTLFLAGRCTENIPFYAVDPSSGLLSNYSKTPTFSQAKIIAFSPAISSSSNPYAYLISTSCSELYCPKPKENPGEPDCVCVKDNFGEPDCFCVKENLGEADCICLKEGFSNYLYDLQSGLYRQSDFINLSGIRSIAFSPLVISSNNTQQLFAAVTTDRNLNFYAISQKGICSQISSFSVESGLNITRVAFSPVLSDAVFYAAITVNSSKTSEIRLYEFTIDQANYVTVPTSYISVTKFDSFKNLSDIAFTSTAINNKNTALCAVISRVTSGIKNTVYTYRLDAFNNLQSLSSAVISNDPYGINGMSFTPIFPPTSENPSLFLAISNNLIRVFNVNLSNNLGALSQVEGSPFKSTCAYPMGLAYSPYLTINNSNYIYLAVPNDGCSTISMYKVNLVGSPTQAKNVQEEKLSPAFGTTARSKRKTIAAVKYINNLKWQPPRFGRESIGSYRIFRQRRGCKKQLIATIPGGGRRSLQLVSKSGRKYSYFITAVNDTGEESPYVRFKITKKRIF